MLLRLAFCFLLSLLLVPVLATPLKLAVQPGMLQSLLPLYSRWFHEAGLETEFIVCTSARCNSLNRSGIIDGEALSLYDFDQSNPDMVRVSPVIAELGIYTLSLTGLPESLSRAELLGGQWRFICVRGNVWCEQQIPATHVIWSNNLYQAASLLLRGRAQLLILWDKPELTYIPETLRGVPVFSRRVDLVTYHLFLNKGELNALTRLEKAWMHLQQANDWRALQQLQHSGEELLLQNQIRELLSGSATLPR